MPSPELHRELEAAWPPPRRGLLGKRPPDDVSPALDDVLHRIAADGDVRWAFILLSRAWGSAGALQERVLDMILAMLVRAPVGAWTWLDEVSRPGWAMFFRQSPLPDDGTRHASNHHELLDEAARGWCDASTLDEIRARLGRHPAVLILASGHPRGCIRQPAVVELAGDIRALPALLLRANDWVRPVRDDALMSLHGLVAACHAEAWLRALPLLVRLEHCGRAAHGALLDRVGGLFRDPAARPLLLDAIGAAEMTLARAAASMARLAFGNSDRDVVAALLRCPDTLVRMRAVDPASSALDGELLDAALRDPVPTVRRRALDVLRVRRVAEFLDRLPSACFDRSGAVREYAIFHLRAAGRFDATALAAAARERIAGGRADLVGAAAFLCELETDLPAEVQALCDHASGRVRLLVKRRLFRALRDGDPIYARLVDDPSPKVARRLIALLRARGAEPDRAQIWRRIEESPSDQEACAWLNTFATDDVWAALPYVVRAMDDYRGAVAARARERIDAITRRTFRSYVDPVLPRLEALAASLRACRDPRAAVVADWVRAVTGRRDWAR